LPSSTLTILGNGLNTEVSGRILIESGRLQGLCVHSGENTPAPNTTWAEVGIELGGQALTNRITILAAGWVAGRQVLGWDGNLELDPTMQIYLRIWSVETTAFSLGVLSTRS